MQGCCFLFFQKTDIFGKLECLVWYQMIKQKKPHKFDVQHAYVLINIDDGMSIERHNQMHSVVNRL